MINRGLEHAQLETVPTDMALQGTFFFHSLVIQPPFHPQIWNIIGFVCLFVFICGLLKEILLSYCVPFYQLSTMNTHLGAGSEKKSQDTN